MQNDFIEVYPNLVPVEFCERVKSAFHHMQTVSSSHVPDNDVTRLLPSGFIDGREPGLIDGTQKGEDVYPNAVSRKDEAVYMEYRFPELMGELNGYLQQAIEMYCGKYPSIGSLPFYSCNMKVQRTQPKGGYHIWHFEQNETLFNVLRCLVWTVYLNDMPMGEAETEFLEYDRRIQPKQGSVLLFPSSWTHTHRGNVVRSCDKYIATGWYYMGFLNDPKHGAEQNQPQDKT